MSKLQVAKVLPNLLVASIITALYCSILMREVVKALPTLQTNSGVDSEGTRIVTFTKVVKNPSCNSSN